MDEELDELYAKLALDLMAANASKYSFSRLVEIGKKAFETHKASIQRAICSDNRVREAYSHISEHEKRYELLAVLVDIIVSLKLGISPVVAAMIAIKLGLEFLCDAYWSR